MTLLHQFWVASLQRKTKSPFFLNQEHLTVIFTNSPEFLISTSLHNSLSAIPEQGMQTWAKQTTRSSPHGPVVSTTTKLSDSMDKGEIWNRKKKKMLGARRGQGSYGAPRSEGNKGQAVQKAGRKRIPSSRPNTCKGPEVGMDLAGSRKNPRWMDWRRVNGG